MLSTRTGILIALLPNNTIQLAARPVIIFLLIAVSLASNCQVPDPKMVQIVLKKNNRHATFKFLYPKDSTLVYLHYLGDLYTKKGRKYKVMTSIYLWGLELHRATNRVLIFNSKNQYVGQYDNFSTDELPGEIRGDNLIFRNAKGSNCDPILVTVVSFYRGIPKMFFRRCKGQYGDLYYFGEN
ncbi:MAG: hypothetical protein Q8938_13220 [Bacteroidota bacterium]|nr:hypothetical protein [Bacteroidota bacterium]MDP4258077.1 hypothetical protein [Bacteroidota bacterium]